MTREKRRIPDNCWHCKERIENKRVYFSIQDPSSTDNIVTHKAGPCRDAAVEYVVNESHSLTDLIAADESDGVHFAMMHELGEGF